MGSEMCIRDRQMTNWLTNHRLPRWLAAVASLPVLLLVLLVLLGLAGFLSGIITPSRDMLVRAAAPKGAPPDTTAAPTGPVARGATGRSATGTRRKASSPSASIGCCREPSRRSASDRRVAEFLDPHARDLEPSSLGDHERDAALAPLGPRRVRLVGRDESLEMMAAMV